MPAGRKGVKFGIERVEAISGPLDGQLMAGRVTATADGQWLPLSATAVRIEGVSIKALDGNTGVVNVTGIGGAIAGYELGAGQAVSMAIDDLAKIQLWFATTGQGVCYIAIARNTGP